MEAHAGRVRSRVESVTTPGLLRPPAGLVVTLMRDTRLTQGEAMALGAIWQTIRRNAKAGQISAYSLEQAHRAVKRALGRSDWVVAIRLFDDVMGVIVRRGR